MSTTHKFNVPEFAAMQVPLLGEIFNALYGFLIDESPNGGAARAIKLGKVELETYEFHMVTLEENPFSDEDPNYVALLVRATKPGWGPQEQSSFYHWPWAGNVRDPNFTQEVQAALLGELMQYASMVAQGAELTNLKLG